MPWIEQINPDTMQPQWAFQEYDPFTGEYRWTEVRNTPPTPEATARNDPNRWWEGQGATVGQMVNGPNGSEKLGLAVDPTTNTQVSNIPKSVADARGYVGWTDVLPKPFEGALFDDIGGNILLPGIAAAMGGLGGASSLSSLLGGGTTGTAGAGALTSLLSGGNPVTGAAMGGLRSLLPIASGGQLPGGQAGFDLLNGMDMPDVVGGAFENPAAVAGWESGLPSSVTGAADPIEAIINMSEAAGTTATPAAQGFGFGGVEEALKSINPAWVGAGLGAAALSQMGGDNTEIQDILNPGDEASGVTTPNTSGGDPDLPGIGQPGWESLPGSTPYGTSTIPASLWSRLLDGTASADEYMNLLGKAAPGLLGAYASSQQNSGLVDLARSQQEAENARYQDLVGRDERRYQTALQRENEAIAKRDAALAEFRGYGAPYRSRLSELSADPSSFLSSAEVTTPVQQGTDIMARALSAKVGNPIGSGGALQELQNYATNSLFGRLGQEKDRLAGFGGLSQFNTSGAGIPGLSTTLPTGTNSGSGVGTGGGNQAETAALGSNANIYNSLGYGLDQVLNPKTSLADLLKQYGGGLSLV